MNIIYTTDEEKYDDYIKRLLQSRPNKKDKDNYMERHHIIPRSMNGSNDEDNLIYLYPYEHYYCHKKLALENQENYKLVKAWWLMSHIKSNDYYKQISAEEYRQARELFSKILSEKLKGQPLNDNCIAGAKLYREELKVKVKCVETGEEYDSFTDASNKTKISYGNIAAAANGRRGSAGVFIGKLLIQQMSKKRSMIIIENH